jgi:N-acyl-D-amino-acid deacylase
MGTSFDLLLTGGLVVDGSAGALPRRADVAVSRGRIAAVGDLKDSSAAWVVDAQGSVVAPGFIDAHVHSEHALVHATGQDRFGSLIQGVTTHVTGADGFGWAPLAPDGGSLWRSTSFAYGEPDARPAWQRVEDYLRTFKGTVPVNVAPVAPHQALRFGTMGWSTAAPDISQQRSIRRALEEWLTAGAFGFATGLDYQPAASASTAELIELLWPVARAGGVFLTHQRYRELGRVGALRESVRIGRATGIPVAVAHEYLDDELRPVVDDASDIELTFDWYGYPASSTHLLATLPVGEYAGGPDAVIERLRDPRERRRVGTLMERAILEPAEPGSIAYIAATRTGAHIGRSIPDLAAEYGVSVGEMAARLLEDESPSMVMVYRRGVSEAAFQDEIRASALDARWTVASDGIYHGGRPHPRGYGAFVRHLRTMRETGLLSVGGAVHQMTGAVAERLRIADRGYVRNGLAADLVVFDPLTVADRATWDQPRAEPVGVSTVLVNGVVAVSNGHATGALAGKVLARGGAS